MDPFRSIWAAENLTDHTTKIVDSGAADQEGANQRKNAQPLYAVKGWMSLTDKCVEKEHNL
jgi:hypothetical protein